MANTVEISRKTPEWMQSGDAIRKYYVTFLEISPYSFILCSLPFLFGLYFEFILYYLASHLFIYIILLKNFNNISSKAKKKMGMISDALEELDRAKKAKEVPKDIYYFANYGTIVEDFQGDTITQAQKYNLNPNNTLYEYLVGKDIYMTHSLIAGSTGAGKTVAITSAYIEPLIKCGSGFIYAECKGDMPITHGVMSMAAEYGREDDVFVLDFSGGASKYTHSVAPLKNGNATNLLEALTNLINVMKGDNSWVTDKALEFMGSILFPLVIMRDLGLFVSADDLKKINPQNWKEDFESLEKLDFTFAQLRSYNSFQNAINMYYLFRELFEQKSFMEHLSNHPNYKQVVDFEGDYLTDLKLFLENHGINVNDRLNIPDYFKAVNADQQRENNKAVQPWTLAFKLFGNMSIFGSVVNKRYPDIDFLDAIRRNKIIVISLPSLQNSRDKNEKIGKFITSMIKAALGEMLNRIGAEGKVKDHEAMKKYRPYKLPYMLLFDEIGNIGNEMMGQMASMIRSIGTEGGGIGMLIAGQSETDLKRIGEGQLDGEQLKANVTIKYYLSLSDKFYAETASEQCGQYERFDWSENVTIRQSSEADLIDSITSTRVNRYEKDYFLKELKKKTGEGILIQDGFYKPEKVVCRYVEPKPIIELKLQRNISHDELLSNFYVNNKNYKEEKDSERDAI